MSEIITELETVFENTDAATQKSLLDYITAFVEGYERGRAAERAENAETEGEEE